MRKRGFTLIEIMVVVVIIGLLAAFAGPWIWQAFARGQEDIAAAKCKELHDRLNQYVMMTKESVPDSFDAVGPISRGETEPFIQPENDPWGNPYVIDKIGGRKFRIVSFGPDGDEGTEDDIVYPESSER